MRDSWFTIRPRDRSYARAYAPAVPNYLVGVPESFKVRDGKLSRDRSPDGFARLLNKLEFSMRGKQIEQTL